MQYEMYTNEKLQRVIVSLLCFLLILLMANIIVQSIQVQEVYASPYVSALPYDQWLLWLEQHAPEILTVLIGVGGMALDPTQINPVEAFGAYIYSVSEDPYNTIPEIMNTIDSFTGNNCLAYNEIPWTYRSAVLDFVNDIWTGITGEGLYVVQGTSVQQGAFTGEGATINSPVEYPVSLSGGGTFLVTGVTPGDAVLWRWWNPLSDDPPKWQISWNYYNDVPQLRVQYRTGIMNQYRYFPINNSFTFRPDGFYVDGINEIPALGDAVFQDDIVLRLYRELDEPIVLTDLGTAYEISDTAVLDPGLDWRQENEDTLRREMVPPWIPLGREGIRVPDGGVTENTRVGDVTVPLDVPVDYPSDWPIEGDVPVVGDLPVDIPAEASGSWINKLLIPFEGMQDKFPFSLPWDIMRILRVFDHYEAVAPSFEIPYDMFLLSEYRGTGRVFSFDFGVMQDYVEIIRFFELIIADLILIMWILRHYVSG